MLKCVLWDFGDTLADERWMLEPLDGVPEWQKVWARVAGVELADAWNLGQINASTVISAVAARLRAPVEQVADHVARCSADLRFFEAPLRIARNSKLPQALVTINPDAFSSLVVPSYDLAQLFKPIVTSWEERTLDKGELAARALELLCRDIHPSEALLIDNKSSNVEAWERRGGRGYVFRNEKTFVADLCGPLEELASSAIANTG